MWLSATEGEGVNRTIVKMNLPPPSQRNMATTPINPAKIIKNSHPGGKVKPVSGSCGLGVSMSRGKSVVGRGKRIKRFIATTTRLQLNVFQYRLGEVLTDILLCFLNH
jgi:hypothetical protein